MEGGERGVRDGGMREGGRGDGGGRNGGIERRERDIEIDGERKREGESFEREGKEGDRGKIEG